MAINLREAAKKAAEQGLKNDSLANGQLKNPTEAPETPAETKKVEIKTPKANSSSTSQKKPQSSRKTSQLKQPTEIKNVHFSLAIKQSVNEKLISEHKKQGFRSRNDFINAILESYLESI